jgi:hypothetical protein
MFRLKWQPRRTLSSATTTIGCATRPLRTRRLTRGSGIISLMIAATRAGHDDAGDRRYDGRSHVEQILPRARWRRWWHVGHVRCATSRAGLLPNVRYGGRVVCCWKYRTAPFLVARGNLSGLRSRSGLRLGATVSDVRRVYGPAPIVYADGKPELTYVRSIPLPGTKTLFVISTSFVLVDGKVAQIARISGV